MLNLPPSYYLISAGACLLLASLGYLAYSLLHRPEKDALTYEEQLQELISDTPDTGEKVLHGESPLTRWNTHWFHLYNRAGLPRYSGNKDLAGRETFLAWLLLAVTISVLFKNVFAGFFIACGGLFILQTLLKNRIKQASQAITNQLPGFLAALKANVQANETPERAILKVVDNMPSPLREELTVVKNKILANATFKEALEDLQERTTSNELKMLCAFIIQATSSGASLETQIGNIQHVLVERQKVADEVNKAVRGASPSILVATIAIPGVFLATYLIDPNSRAYWFTQFSSWIVLGLVAALYAVGMFFARREASKILNN